MLRGTIGRRRAFRNEAVIAFVFADILLSSASAAPLAMTWRRMARPSSSSTPRIGRSIQPMEPFMRQLRWPMAPASIPRTMCLGL